jgi:hypothetical protein
MELTEEQQERIRRNRERALEIQRKRKEEQLAAASETKVTGNSSKRQKGNCGGETKEKGEDDDVELEDFEVGASEFVSKKEAKETYCLPDGTLAVCAFVEKENPRNKAWAPLKLYNRAEIRRRARARFGGLQGLVEERRKREEKRFRKDLKTAKDIFK